MHVRPQILIPLSLCSLVLLVGCTTPSAANITLRRENQQLRTEIDELKRAREADALTIQALEAKTGTLPTLPATRMSQLFTAQTLKLNNKLTAGADLDPKQPGDEGIKVYVVPADQTGGAIKAAGEFTVEAFDLADPSEPLVGRWTFAPEEAGKNFYDSLLLYTYVLTCPWQKVPAHPELTVKVAFKDALTQRTLPPVQKVIHVSLPPQSPAPATQPPTANANGR